jgi:Mrp family chromosome partitioning ATPase
VIVVAEPKGHTDAATVALGLAATFAESGRLVLAIDGNLRDRESSNALGPAGAPGLGEVLEGSIYIDEAIVATDRERLKILPAGGSQQSPGQLLGGPEISQLIKHVRGEYDLVVVCSSAILPYSDTLAIAASSAGVLLVARARATQRDHLASASAKVRMAGVESLGVVVTNLK